MVGVEASTIADTAASLSAKNLIDSVTYDLAVSGKCGDSSEADSTPMTAASMGQGSAQSSGDRCSSAMAKAAWYTGKISLTLGTGRGWYG